MDKLPFTVYDFFGCLSSGFVVLVSITAAFVGYEPLKDNPGFIFAVLFIVLAYITGHIVANLSGDLIERRLVHNKLGMPSEQLLRPDQTGLWATLFPGYHGRLPTTTQQRVRTRAADRDFTDKDEAL